ncbi:hypothetical protein ACIGA4_11880 [Staphylococcus capitis]|uniref:hypothetical protein n=1 Tax=Staphylococcus capitis TaxID=29388 RepID=UPI0037D424B4
MKKVLGLILGTGVLLAACGSNGSPEANKKEVSFGEIMNKGEQISYEIRNYEGELVPTKNSAVSSIIKTDNGKVTAYNVEDDIELKDLKDKSKKEIIDLAKKQDKKYMLRSKNDNIAQLKYNIKTVKNDIEGEVKEKEEGEKEIEDYEKMIKELNNYEYKNPKERKLKIEAVEDNTGNNTSLEEIFSAPQTFDIDNSYNEAYDDGSTTYSSYDKGNETMKIYDKNYAYLSDSDNEEEDDDEDESEKYFLVTPVSDKTEYSKLDKPDSKNVKAIDDEEEE